jgi:hypothetical protein
MPTLIESLVTPCVVLDPEARYVAPIVSVASTRVAAPIASADRQWRARGACFAVLM